MGTHYDDVADEYYDPKRHPTSANFNFLSRVYIRASLKGRSKDLFPALEIGAGASSIAPILTRAGSALSGLTITDASIAMLAHSKKWESLGARLEIDDAEHLHQHSATFRTVVAGLADPYNTKRFWREVARVLRPDGWAVVTMPSHDWAFRFRKLTCAPIEYAYFERPDGTTAAMPSSVYPLPEQIEMIQGATLEIHEFRALTAADLKNKPLAPKLDVFRNRSAPLLWGFRVRKTA